MQVLRSRFEQLVSSQAAALGCSAEVDWMQEAMPYYPPTVNDAETYKFAADVATRCCCWVGLLGLLGLRGPGIVLFWPLLRFAAAASAGLVLGGATTGATGPLGPVGRAQYELLGIAALQSGHGALGAQQWLSPPMRRMQSGWTMGKLALLECRLLGEPSVLEAEPSMAGEDFAFLAKAAPGAFMFLGTRNEELG